MMLEREHGIWVVFADVDMPSGDNGLELARKVHRQWPDIRLVVTSSHSLPLRISRTAGVSSQKRPGRGSSQGDRAGSPTSLTASRRRGYRFGTTSRPFRTIHTSGHS